MTVQTTECRVDYAGDGSSTSFAVPWQFFLTTDLVVILRAEDDGTEDEQEIATDYTVAGGEGSTGAVTFLSAPSSAVTVSILRDTARLQSTDYVDYDAFPAESHERALDRLTFQTQELALADLRAIRVQRSDRTDGLVLPPAEQRAERVLAFDAQGDVTVLDVDGLGNLSLSETYINSVVNAALQDILPIGSIILWAGSVASIPAGWALCNGSGGTPDLRGRFVIGAGGAYGVNATGGAASATTSSDGAHDHGGAAGGTALTVEQLPPHKHSMGTDFVRQVGSGGVISGIGTFATGASETQNAGSGQTHDHTIASGGAHDHTVATVPPYYALCYIMRVGALPGGGGDWVVKPEVLQFAASDETTEIDAGTGVITLRMPYAMTLQEVRASLGTASTSGAVTIDINQGGASILSTKLTIDQGEKTSTTAAAPAVISTIALTDDAEITVDIDGAGADAAGLKIVLIGVRA